MKKTKGRVAVAMSGGVDSSVAAALLKESGYDVIGMTMRLAGGGRGLPRPETPDDSSGRRLGEDAQKVAEKLGISHHVIDLRVPFEREIVGDFCLQYKSGKTPNPCIRCNPLIKFGLLFDEGRRLGADFMATGHYARIERESRSGLRLLKKGRDKAKDQSYFLFRLNQGAMARLLMPLGGLTKTKVRSLAKRMGLFVAEKPESQEICFIPGGDYAAFLSGRIPEAFKPGPIVDLDGRTLGKHRGIPAYTIGQRRGLGIAAPRPLYVVSIDADADTVVVGPDEALYKKSLLASEVSLVSGGRIQRPVRATVKIRYRHEGVRALVSPHGDSGARIDFEKPQRAITPGQAVVFYRGNTVLGGGTIESVID